MALRQLSLNEFRNLSSCTLEFNPRYNLLFGENGSGKTSLLETIHILCQGRSFKTRHLDECIKDDHAQFLLFGQFTHHKVGISHTAQHNTIRIDGSTTKKLSDLARHSPVKIIDSSCFNLVTGRPSHKREFIDWCLFHVEHPFQLLWQKHSHALKQRNMLLRSKKSIEQLEYWDTYLSDYSNEIHDYRKKYISLLRNSLNETDCNLFSSDNLDIIYEPGWDTAFYLNDIYRKNRQKELKYGYTLYGSHRDNITLLYQGKLAQKILSRGQLKKLSIALYLAQMSLVNELTGKPIIVLLDDLHAELDDKNVKIILKQLSTMKSQVFITSIELLDYLVDIHQEFKLFHVEHGMIKSVKTP